MRGHIRGTQLGVTLRLFAHRRNTPEAICVSCMLRGPPKAPLPFSGFLFLGHSAT